MNYGSFIDLNHEIIKSTSINEVIDDDYPFTISPPFICIV